MPKGESAYQGLKDKVDALPELSVPTSDDANDNDIPDDQENNKVEISFTKDTGSSATDKITNNGELTLTLKESTDTITKVEVNGTPLQPVDGKYILPEGEYAVGSIVVTSQDASGVESTSQNNKLMIVDTTAPTDAPDIARTTEQGTDISLPIDAKVGDQVLIHIGKDVVILTKTSDGWQSSNNEKVAIVDDAGTAKGRIPLDAAATGTTVIAQNVDAAGNIGAQITTKSIINPGEVTIVLDKDANFNVDNDQADQVVLNLAEGERASGSDRQNLTTVPVKAYFPEGTSIGDHYNLTMVTSQFPDGITTRNREITQDMIEKGWSFNINGIDNGQGSVSITLVSDKPEINGKSSTLTVALDKDMPNDPVVHTAEDGSVSVDLPTKNAPYADGSPAKQADVQVGDKVVIKDGDFVATVTKTKAGWESDNPQVTIDGNTAKIASGVLQGGSTVEAQAIDNVGNESGINSAKIASAPLRVQSLTLTDEHDQFNPTYAVKQSDDRAINFSYQLSGPVDEHTSQYVRIQLFKEGESNPVQTMYKQVEAGKTEYSDEFSTLLAAAKDEKYTVKVDLVNSNNGSDVDTKAGSQTDNIVVETPDKVKVLSKEWVDESTVKLTLNRSVTSSSDLDTTDFNQVTVKFGDARTDKYHDLTDSDGHTIRVTNVKADWDMRMVDDFENENSSDYSNDPYVHDHAEGWKYDTEAVVRDATLRSGEPRTGLFYRWDGDDTKGDTIIVSTVRTDSNAVNQSSQGMIAGENKGLDSNQPRFVVDTHGGGDDYIEASGMGGNSRIITNDGNDTIRLGYLSGRSGVGIPFFDGSNQIIMGEGNDTLDVYADSASVSGRNEIGRTTSSFYYTNAKVDMGEGNNTVTITGNVIAGEESASGNYFKFGSGNDTMTVGKGILGQNTGEYYKGSNIIDLGSGTNKLDVKGQFGDSKLALVIADGDNTIKFGSMGGYSSLMLGDGTDNVTVSGNVNILGGAYSSLSDIFVANKEASKQNEWYQNYYDANLPNEINNKLSQTAAIVAAGGDSSENLGANTLNTGSLGSSSTQYSRTSLGNGNNSFTVNGTVNNLHFVGGNNTDTVVINGNNGGNSVTNSKFWMGNGENNFTLAAGSSAMNYYGGNDVDAVTIKGNADRSRFWMQNGNNQLVFGGNTNEIGYSGGTGNDVITIAGNATGDSTYNLGTGGNNSLTINGNSDRTWVGVDSGDSNDTVYVGGNFTGRGKDSASIMLGNGNNAFSVKGSTTDLLYIGGDGVDIVRLGTVDGIDYNAKTANSIINLGAGNDRLEIADASFTDSGLRITNVQINAGDGDDTVAVHNVSGTYFNLDAGDGNDTIYLYGQPTMDNTNKVYGGNGIDTLHIGSKADGAQTTYSIGHGPAGQFKLESIEKIVFHGVNSNSGDKLDIKAEQDLTDDPSGKIFIRVSQEVMDAHAKVNTVYLNSQYHTGWGQDVKFAPRGVFTDSDGITYVQYSQTKGGKSFPGDSVYIQASQHSDGKYYHDYIDITGNVNWDGHGNENGIII